MTWQLINLQTQHLTYEHVTKSLSSVVMQRLYLWLDTIYTIWKGEAACDISVLNGAYQRGKGKQGNVTADNDNENLDLKQGKHHCWSELSINVERNINGMSQSVGLGWSNNPNTTPTKDYKIVQVVVYLHGIQRGFAEERERGSTPTGWCRWWCRILLGYRSNRGWRG